MFRIHFLSELWPVFWICLLKTTAESAPLNFGTPNSMIGNNLMIPNIENSNNKSHEGGTLIFLSTDFQESHKNTEEQENSSREIEKYVSEELKEKNKTPRKKLVEYANEQPKMVTDKAADINQLGTTTYSITNENTIFEREKNTDETMNLKALKEAEESRTDISKKSEENPNSTATQFAETYDSKLIVDKVKLTNSVENTEEHNLVKTTDYRQPETSTYLNLVTEKSREVASRGKAEEVERLSNWIVAQKNDAMNAVQTNIVAESKPAKANTKSNITVTKTVGTTIKDIDEPTNSWGFQNNLIFGSPIGKSSILLETAAYCGNGVLVGKWCHSRA